MSEEVKINEENQYSFENPEYRKTYWHTCSHVLAQAVKRLWPEVKLAIGPSIETGFYYDLLAPFAFTPEHLEQIEAEMRKICKEKLKLERFELPREEAIKFMEEKDEPFKVELINDLPEDAVISFYKQGEFTDLCAGPHLDSTGRIKGNGIKLTACNAAYWRGDSKRETLQRIYGVAFPKKDELDAYLEEREEAVKRDHSKLGRELGPVHDRRLRRSGPSDVAAQGLRASWQALWKTRSDDKEHKLRLSARAHDPADRPRVDLYKTSGHWDHYLKQNMFILGDPDGETMRCFALRPMTCPHQYAASTLNQPALLPQSARCASARSPDDCSAMRRPATMHGLIRARPFTICQNDAHLVRHVPSRSRTSSQGLRPDLASTCQGLSAS
ncbi:MAG: hypothetical protein ACLSHJ_11335 [Oscillospiraceae bacterium]